MDDALDPSLAGLQQTYLHQPSGPLSLNDTKHEAGLDPASYHITVATSPSHTRSLAHGKRDAPNPIDRPLVLKRSVWNAFYKEQFALYHANHPPTSKQNARQRSGFPAYA